MTRRLRVHFDGRVIVPDEPVDLPIDEPLEAVVGPHSYGASDVSNEPRPGWGKGRIILISPDFEHPQTDGPEPSL